MNIVTIPINEIFGPKCGCPFCRMESMLEERYVEYIVGDAMMAPEELYHPYGSNYLDINCGCSSMQWFERIKARYPKIAWLNPSMHTDTSHSYFLQTEKALKQVFPMYFLSVNGMTEAMRMLISSR
jgi:uncharacterized protein with von Willebrand factor type A (vWA) domain